MTIINILALLFTCRQLLYVQGQDIYYCNDVPLNWRDAIKNCQNDGGMPVPFSMGDGRTLVNIGLRDDLYVWTADFSARQRVFDFQNETRYECKYVNVSTNGTKSLGYDDCFSSKRYVRCKQSDNICNPAIKYGTWNQANIDCGIKCDGKEYNAEGSYWVNFVYQIIYSYVSEKNITDVLHDQLRSCGVYKGKSSTLTYRPCDSEKIKSLCKFSIDASVPDHYTRSCLNSSVTPPVPITDTSTSGIPIPQTSTQNTNQLTYSAAEFMSSTGDHDATEKNLTSDHTTKVKVTQGAESLKESEGYGLKIGLPVAAVVLLLSIIVFLIYWKRRNLALRKEQNHKSANQLETQTKATNVRNSNAYVTVNTTTEITTFESVQNKTYDDSDNSHHGEFEESLNHYIDIDDSGKQEKYDDDTYDKANDICDGEYVYDKTTDKSTEYDTTKALSTEMKTENIYNKTFQTENQDNNYDCTGHLSKSNVDAKDGVTENIYNKTFQTENQDNNYNCTDHVSKSNADAKDRVTENVYNKTFQTNDCNTDYYSTVNKTDKDPEDKF